MNHLLLYCRPGFEAECAAEIKDTMEAIQLYGYTKTQDHSGYVLYVTHEPEGAFEALQRITFQDLIFPRQWVACRAPLTDLDSADRVTPIVASAAGLPRCGELLVESADTNEGRELQTLCRKLTSPCVQAFRRAGLIAGKRALHLPRLHLFFSGPRTVFVGISLPENSSPSMMGIMRLKFPRKAPSRSTLKLEEAWHHFLKPAVREQHLAPGMKAVDLGAAPGGWTWQLVNQHMMVTAVDNGPMNADLMESGQVKHVRIDGFQYTPPKRVDWMVCDIADKPARVTALVAKWIGQGWCDHCVFNLKLPMKKRYQEVLLCQSRLQSQLEGAGCRYEVGFKHLYYDREEITGYIRKL